MKYIIFLTRPPLLVSIRITVHYEKEIVYNFFKFTVGHGKMLIKPTAVVPREAYVILMRGSISTATVIFVRPYTCILGTDSVHRNTKLHNFDYITFLRS